jgi:N-acyl homoserine lactone hydrolase
MELTIRPLLLGEMRMNLSLMTYMMNFHKEIWVPIVCWYLRVEDKHVLVDTGAPAEIIRKYWYGEYKEVKTFADALSTVSVSPPEIDIVIQTHLHFDHCGNTSECRNAEVMVQTDELKFARNPHPLFLGSYLRGEALDGVHFREVEGDTELLPGVKVVKAPGHSPGTQAVAIETAAGLAVLSGFCAVADNFSPPEKMRKVWPVLTPGVHTDSLAAFASAIRVREIADVIIPIHDMEYASKHQIP